MQALSSAPALVEGIGGHSGVGGRSGFPNGTVRSFTLAPPHPPPHLTAHFIYDPKMNRPTEVPSLLAQPSWLSGGVERGPLGRSVGAWVAVFMGCRLRQGRSEAGLGQRPAWSCPASPV